jgi:hypothetical protein
LLKNLAKAIKEGKISKEIGRCIVRRLQKRNILIDPELLEVVNSENSISYKVIICSKSFRPTEL